MEETEEGRKAAAEDLNHFKVHISIHVNALWSCTYVHTYIAAYFIATAHSTYRSCMSKQIWNSHKPEVRFQICRMRIKPCKMPMRSKKKAWKALKCDNQINCYSWGLGSVMIQWLSAILRTDCISDTLIYLCYGKWFRNNKVMKILFPPTDQMDSIKPKFISWTSGEG